MPALPFDWPGIVFELLKIGVAFGGVMTAVVLIERAGMARMTARTRYVETRYRGLVSHALAGDCRAAATLAATPVRHRLDVAAMLILPLIDDRDPVRIARTRQLITSMSIVPLADRYLRSGWWWRRAIAVRALGLIQMCERTAQLVAALDDSHADVRGAALDALRDLQNTDALRAIVVRINDASLPLGRRAAALAAFGAEAEAVVLELAQLAPDERAKFARALKFCGTARSRATLLRWTFDARPEVQAAALEALARVGLDEEGAKRALECLEHEHAGVRAMAAHALRGWSGSTFTAAQLARHLDDVWPVAVRSAQSLRAMRPYGLDALRLRAQRDDHAGVLARQMLWEERLPA